MNKAIAMRIGLAARELPGTDVTRLLGVLADAVGLPPTGKALAALTVKKLKRAAGGEFAEIDGVSLESALAYLKGEKVAPGEPLPEAQPYRNGDMPNSIRVACASNKGEDLDGHFGSCQRFLIYQVSSEAYRLVDVRSVDLNDRAAADEKNGYRAALIGDCQILFAVSIGGPAAAKVVRAGVHPIKKPEMGDARTEVASLQSVIGANAPPWLAKVLGQTPEERIRFARETGL